MPPADDETPDVRVVGGAEPRPRRPASDLSSIRASARGEEGSTAESAERPPLPDPPRTADAARTIDRSAFNVLLVVTALLTVATLVFGMAWGFGWGNTHGTVNKNVTVSAGSKEQREMTGVARTFLQAFSNFDPDHIDAMYNQVLGLATGDFQREWPTLFPPDVRQSIKQYRAQMRGELRNFFVQDFGGDHGEVFAVVDVTYANNSKPQPTPDTYRFDIKLVTAAGKWKISQVDLLNSPGADAGLTGTGAGGSSSSSTVAPSTTTAP
jgi:hypothetical protein